MAESQSSVYAHTPAGAWKSSSVKLELSQCSLALKEQKAGTCKFCKCASHQPTPIFYDTPLPMKGLTWFPLTFMQLFLAQLLRYAVYEKASTSKKKLPIPLRETNKKNLKETKKSPVLGSEFHVVVTYIIQNIFVSFYLKNICLQYMNLLMKYEFIRQKKYYVLYRHI